MGRSQGFGMNSLSNNIFNGTGKLFVEQFGSIDNYKHLCTILRLPRGSFFYGLILFCKLSCVWKNANVLRGLCDRWE